jgi:hypothetical protein
MEELIELIKSLVGNEYLYFDTAVVIKKTPHTIPLNMWAVSVSPSGKVYVMDADEKWHEVEEKDSRIIASLYQRLKLISEQYKKAS